LFLSVLSHSILVPIDKLLLSHISTDRCLHKDLDDREQLFERLNSEIVFEISFVLNNLIQDLSQ